MADELTGRFGFQSFGPQDPLPATRTDVSGSGPTGNGAFPSLAPETRAYMTEMVISYWKSKLGLDRGICGALTKYNRSCMNGIRLDNKDRIDSQVKSMMEFTLPAWKLEVELEKLVMLVHCHRHDCGSAKDSRIQAWAQALPVTDDYTRVIISVKRQIKNVLGPLSTRCIWTTSSDKPCSHKIGGQSVQNRTKIIDEIVKPEIYFNDEALLLLVEVLEVHMYCHRHDLRRLPGNAAIWKQKIVEIRDMADWESLQLVASNAPEELKLLIRSKNCRGTGNLPTEYSGLVVALQSFLKVNALLTRLWPGAYDTSALNITETSRSPGNYRSSYWRVRSKIREPLDQEEQNDGYLYVYEVAGNKRFVKIGYTTCSVETRLQEWKFDCNRYPRLIYPLDHGSAMLIPNAARVEALCHAELDHCRIRIYCQACLKQHLEWFEISPTEVISVVQKWSTWIATDPYFQGSLREEEWRRLQNMDRFMNEISFHNLKANVLDSISQVLASYARLQST